MKDEYFVDVESKENIRLIFNIDGRLALIKAGDYIIDNPAHRRIKLLRHYGINLIFDIGANTGQYAKNMRSLGYMGRLVSFEPLSEAFVKLKRNTKNDPLWEAVNIAIGEVNENRIINIAGNSRSSSFLPMLPLHIKYSPHTKYIDKEKVTMKTLDSIIDKYMRCDEKLFLKIDTQGYEKEVINGALKSLEKISGIQMELSLVSLYEGEGLFSEMINLMENLGYLLVSLEPGYSIPTGQLFQVDAIFASKSLGVISRAI